MTTSPAPGSPAPPSPASQDDLAAHQVKLASVSPARAWKTARALALDGRADALALAAEFAGIAEPDTDKLLRLWPQVPDRDGFAELLLAPAFEREGRTELEIRRRDDLTGLRHLTTLRALRLDHCKKLTDLSELATLTALTRLELDGCAAVADLTPLSGLTALRELSLLSARALTDLSPLFTLRGLRRLDLRSSGVTSVKGVGDAFPELEYLSLDHCRAIDDVLPLSGLSRLTELDLSGTKIRSLAGLRDLGSVAELSMHCARLTGLDGIDAMPNLVRLWLSGCTKLKSLDGLGHHPRLTSLGLPDARIPDLRPLVRLPALERLHIGKWQGLTTLDGLQGHPSIAEIHLAYPRDLRDFSALAHMPALRELTLQGVDQLTDLTPFSELRVLERLRVVSTGLRALGDPTGLPALRDLDLRDCPALTDLGSVAGLPSLEEVRVRRCPALPPALIADLDARGLLRD